MVGEMYVERDERWSDRILKITPKTQLVRLFHYVSAARTAEAIKREGLLYRGVEAGVGDSVGGVNFTTIPPTVSQLEIIAGTGLTTEEDARYCLFLRVPRLGLYQPLPEPFPNTWRANASAVQVIVDSIVDMERNKRRIIRGQKPVYPFVLGRAEKTGELPYHSSSEARKYALR